MLNILVFQTLSKRHYTEIQFWGFENVYLSYHDRLHPPPPPKKNHVIIVNIFVQQS